MKHAPWLVALALAVAGCRPSASTDEPTGEGSADPAGPATAQAEEPARPIEPTWSETFDVATAVGVTASASGYYPDPSVAETFAPAAVMDGRPETAWQVELSSPDDPAWIELRFPARVSIDRLEVLNGFQWPGLEYGDLFMRNARAAEVVIMLDDQQVAAATLPPTDRSPQTIEVGGAEGIQLRVRVDRSHAGDSWNDLSISELRVIGRMLSAPVPAALPSVAGMQLGAPCDVCGPDVRSMQREVWVDGARMTATIERDLRGDIARIELRGEDWSVSELPGYAYDDPTSHHASPMLSSCRRLATDLQRWGQPTMWRDDAIDDLEAAWQADEWHAELRADSWWSEGEGLTVPRCELTLTVEGAATLCSDGDGFSEYWQQVHDDPAAMASDVDAPLRIFQCSTDPAGYVSLPSESAVRRHFEQHGASRSRCSTSDGGYIVRSGRVSFVVRPQVNGWRWSGHDEPCS